MTTRKIKKKNLLKCKGFNVAPCFTCRRWSKDETYRVIEKLTTARNGINSCEHFYSKAI